MINLSKSGDTIVFEFINNGHYLENGTIEVPVNSLSLVTDSSNMATFYKADSNDIFISATYDELGKTKAEMLEWFEENMVGGGGIDSGAVQTQIDQSISGFADSVLYDSTSKYVEFYHGGTGGTKVYEFDASDFVIDGMVDDVRIETISGVSYLVIDFNTASGKEDIQIPLTDIFDPSNYYTKTEVDGIVSGKADSSAVTQEISAAVSGKLDTSTFETYSGSVDTALSGKQDTLSAGTNITIVDNVISAEGGGKAVSGGTNISITTGETADTINCTLPIKTNAWNSLTFNTSRNPSQVLYASAFGDYTTASGKGSFAIGKDTTASGEYSFVGGYNSSQAKGNKSFSFGDGTVTNGMVSVAFGQTVTTNNSYEFSCGKLNKSVSATLTFGDSGNTLFSVGNGTSTYHNAFEIRQNGDIYITSGGTDIKLQDNLGSAIEVSSAITSGDTNPVQGGVLYDELRVETPTQVEVVLEWEQSDGGVSTNYPNGCTKLTVEVDENEMASGGYTLYNDNHDCFGFFQIESNNGVITVTTRDCESNPSTSITYSISGNVVTIEYPTITGVTIIDTSYDNYWTFKAIIESQGVKSLKEYTYDKFDEVEQVTAAALNNLSDNFDGLKLKKLTQAQYDALSPNYDNNTLYVIV